MKEPDATDPDAWPGRGPTWFHYHSTLRIFGRIPDLDEITSTLGLTPTSVRRRGDCPESHPRWPYKHDVWSYKAPAPEVQPLDVHIQTLWAHVRPHKHYLIGLKRALSVDVVSGYVTNWGGAGFQVSHLSLEMFRELDIPFGVSVDEV